MRRIVGLKRINLSRSKSYLVAQRLLKLNHSILARNSSDFANKGFWRKLIARTKLGQRFLQKLAEIEKPSNFGWTRIISPRPSASLFKSFDVDLSQEDLYDRFFGPSDFEPFHAVKNLIVKNEIELAEKARNFLESLPEANSVPDDEKAEIFHENLVEFSGNLPYNTRLDFLKAVIDRASLEPLNAGAREKFFGWFHEWQERVLESFLSCWTGLPGINSSDDYSGLFYETRFKNAAQFISKIALLPYSKLHRGALLLNPFVVTLIPELQEYFTNVFSDFWKRSWQSFRFKDKEHALIARALGRLVGVDFGDEFYRDFAEASTFYMTRFGSAPLICSSFAATQLLLRDLAPDTTKIVDAALRRLMHVKDWSDFPHYASETSDFRDPSELNRTFWSEFLGHLAICQKLSGRLKVPEEFWTRVYEFLIDNPHHFPGSIKPTCSCLSVFELRPPMEFLELLFDNFDRFLESSPNHSLMAVGQFFGYLGGPPLHGKVLPEKRLLEKGVAKVQVALQDVRVSIKNNSKYTKFFWSYSKLKGVEKLPPEMLEEWFEKSKTSLTKSKQHFWHMARLMEIVVAVQNDVQVPLEWLEELELSIMEICANQGPPERNRGDSLTRILVAFSKSRLRPRKTTVRAVWEEWVADLCEKSLSASQVSQGLVAINSLLNETERPEVLDGKFWMDFWYSRDILRSASTADLVLLIETVRKAAVLGRVDISDDWLRSWCEAAVELIDEFTASELVTIGLSWQAIGKIPFFADFLENWLVLVVARATQLKSLNQVIVVLRTLVQWKIRPPSSYLSQLLEASENLCQNQQMDSLSSLLRGFSSLSHKIEGDSLIFSQIAQLVPFSRFKDTFLICSTLQSLLIQEVVLGTLVPDSIVCDLLGQMAKFDMENFTEVERRVVQRSRLAFGESALPLKMLKAISRDSMLWNAVTSDQKEVAVAEDFSSATESNLAADFLIQRLSQDSRLISFEQKLERFKSDANFAVARMFDNYAPKDTAIMHNVNLGEIGCKVDTLVKMKVGKDWKNVAFRMIGPQNFFRNSKGKFVDLMRPDCVLISKLLALAGYTVEMVIYSEWLAARESVIQRVNVRYLHTYNEI